MPEKHRTEYPRKKKAQKKVAEGLESSGEAFRKTRPKKGRRIVSRGGGKKAFGGGAHDNSGPVKDKNLM